MDYIKSTGESLFKGREDGDAATGSERPLKKARFAWQVKGKYHLKNDTDETNKNIKSPSAESSSSKLSSSSQGSSSTSRYDVENYLDSVRNPDCSSTTPINSFSNEEWQYPRYISSCERTSNSLLGSNSCNKMKTVSMTSTEDQCIAQWQAKQIVNGRLDNTLNRVLESWTADTQPTDTENTFLARDFAEFINHLPGDNSVENEGILMAISAHGLQNTSSSSSNLNSNADSSSTWSAHGFDIPSPLRSLSPTVSDDDSHHTEVQQYEADKKKQSKIQGWQSDCQNANDSTPFAYFSEPSRSPYNFYHDNLQNSNIDTLDIDNHFDFMNAAVLFAIKSKGLTASGTEYG